MASGINFPDPSLAPWKDPNGQSWDHDGDGWFALGITIKSVPPGGLTGQILIKLSDDDYDVGWADKSAPPLRR